MNDAVLNNIEYARSLQEKYEYYQAGLNFTILAAAIQTIEISSSKLVMCIELSGIFALLVSGVIALLRFRVQPVAHKNFAELQRRRRFLEDARQAREEGTREVLYADTEELIEIAQAIENIESSIAENEPKINALEGTLRSQNKWHHWLFIVGFSLIAISRSAELISSIFFG